MQGFDECTTVSAAFKLFEGFDGLVERDAISTDLERKHADLVRCFLFELREVRGGWAVGGLGGKDMECGRVGMQIGKAAGRKLLPTLTNTTICLLTLPCRPCRG